MSVETTTRTVGTLAAADIGKPVRIEHEGWVHDGTLEVAKHDVGFMREAVCTSVTVVYPSGARKFLYRLDGDHPIEVAIEAASDD